tara:strand:+ start:52 stop:768 length:717 start_codon:yes stop_codon:yes gene_type:complete
MKPICIIPARGGSKGISKKNIRIINKKPLIEFTITSCLKSKIFSHVYVSTEDPKIAAISKKYGAEVPFLRPKNLSTDNVPIDKVLTHFVKKLSTLGIKSDVMVWRDCTVPFIRNIDIKNSIKLLQSKKAELVIGVYEQHLNPYYNIVEMNNSGHLKLVKKQKSRPNSRQSAPKVFQMNGLHVYDVNKALNNNGKILNSLNKAIPFFIPPYTGLMIDTEFEFQLAELMMKNLTNKKIFQ